MTAETITQADDLPRLIGTLTDVRAGKVEPFVRGVSAINKIAIDGSMTVICWVCPRMSRQNINFTADI